MFTDVTECRQDCDFPSGGRLSDTVLRQYKRPSTSASLDGIIFLMAADFQGFCHLKSFTEDSR